MVSQLGVEKRRPTYDLDAIKAAIGSAETLAITRSAFSDALSLGFSRSGIAAVIQATRRSSNLAGRLPCAGR
jgi:motility quorum-sensing regulator / GCU-specific mRNA interferase toxin